MNTEHLKALWTVIGGILASYCLAVWIVGRGGRFVAEKILIESRPVAAELIALFVCSVLLAVVAEIGIRYARISKGDRWHNRLPIVANKTLSLGQLDTSSPEGKWYQRFWLTVFVVLPGASLVHFSRVVLNAEVSDKNDLTASMGPLSGVPLESLVTAAFWDDAFRIGVAAAKSQQQLEGMVTWFPVVEPLALGILLTLALVQCGRLVGKLLLSP